ncbi:MULTISPECIES: TIGR03758 family integrating conjugative element protein [Pseudomonas]|uniref:TIGR03758 family integrating conjugative element protein n=1 Tax=Pseudomonas phytophila TaxID=2867264 RepID=A0ABY6FH51_9PSED|nr:MULTISPECIES: TIGR03758 family integrating conjugative element protein [Pseudomonas]MCD5972341.1 TIGR03758 family integrating conjugative element protein [Pseudomonas quasicaspiana]MDU8358451.1 TIGR03758 family integrating conjugative element protein [Pseudomonas syringae group sp. J309-1]UXZ97220.1 TIGR03758 family integrating conjugative element protein [Pseudomonas phytophila]
MTMSSTQINAFQAAAGFTPASSNTLWTGLAMGILILWGVWVFLSIYRGWATRNLDRAAAAASAVRWALLFMIMTYMLLS